MRRHLPMAMTCCVPLLPPGWQPRSARPLSNGVEMVSLPLAEAPLVCLDFWCRAGSASRGRGSGMAHFLEHMVFKGSAGARTAGEFDRRIEALGGSSNAATGFDDVHYHVLIPPPGRRKALDLLLDLVLRPRLEDDAFAMERQVVLEELAQSEDQPEEVALQRLLALACPDHPYGLPILGRREALLSTRSCRDGRLPPPPLWRRTVACWLLAGALATGASWQRAADRPAHGSAWPPRQRRPPPPPALRWSAGVHRLAVPRLEAARLLMAWWQPPAPRPGGRDGSRSGHHRAGGGPAQPAGGSAAGSSCGSWRASISTCMPWNAAASPCWRRSANLTICLRCAGRSRCVEELMREPLPASRSGSGPGGWWPTATASGWKRPGGSPALIGNNQLWGRRQPLDASPPPAGSAGSPRRLREQALPLLDPARACMLEAVPA